ncbi:MAG: nicotinate-nucleotide adenylyltransferase [Armatimonadetes bacterium]|nr:nicotinate-nucleotide adenylyltransferase [Armatimonadota bacterium]
MRIGVLGGTFDPIHYGHLFIAEDARGSFDLDHVILVPNGRPPHKMDYLPAAAVHRMAMTELATRSNPHFSVSRLEMERAGPSYTVETLQAIRAANPAADLFFIAGWDAVNELASWHQPEKIVELCRIIALTRPGYSMETLGRNLKSNYLSRIETHVAPSPDISASVIRDRILNHKPVRYLLPDEVIEYIERNYLYQSESSPAPSPKTK